MRKFAFIVILFYFSLVGFSQIQKVEYFIDNDPGYGNATRVDITVVNEVDISISADISALPNGFHTIGVRTQATSGTWSMTRVSNFYVYSPTPNENLVTLEYFLDADPGYGNAIDVPVTTGSEVVSNFIPDISTLSDGFHFIGVRAKSASDVWSTTRVNNFYVYTPNPDESLIALEYFIDTDPGLGNATNVPINSDKDVSKSFIPNISSLSQGFHAIGIRAKTESGVWSTTRVNNFYVYTPNPDESLIALEYFIDTDPGLGNATNVPINSDKDVSKSFIPNISSLSQGFHAIGIRAKTESGVWSTTRVNNFYVYTPNPDESLIALEYFIDTDPGLGNATNVPINSDKDVSKSFTPNISSLSQGFHAIGIRTKAESGVWSTTRTQNFYVMQSGGENIAGAEYFFDEDPGFNNGTSILNSSSCNMDSTFIAYISALQRGEHTIFVRVKDDSNNWSITKTETFCKGSVPIFEMPEISCTNSIVEITDESLNTDDNTIWLWDFDGDGEVDSYTSGDTTIMYDKAGTYNVSLTLGDSSTCFSTYTHTIKIAGEESPTITIETDETDVFEGQNVLAYAIIENADFEDVQLTWTINNIRTDFTEEYFNSTLSNGDQLGCILESDYSCTTGQSGIITRSNTIEFKVAPVLLYPDLAYQGESQWIEFKAEQFDSSTTVKLFMGNDDIIPSQTNFIDSNTVRALFDFTGKELGKYDLEIVDTSGSTVFFELFHLKFRKVTEVNFNEWTSIKAANNGVSIQKVQVPSTNRLYVFLKKSNYYNQSTATWEGRLSLIKDGVVISEVEDKDDNSGWYHTYMMDFKEEIDNPQAGEYIFELENFTSDLDAEAEILFTSSPEELVLNEWNKGRVLRPHGFEWKMFEIPTNTNSVTIMTEGFLSRKFTIYQNSIKNPTKKWVFTGYDNNGITEGEITNPEAGTYFVEYSEAQQISSTDQSKDILFYVGTTEDILESPQVVNVRDFSPQKVGRSFAEITVEGSKLYDITNISLQDLNSDILIDSLNFEANQEGHSISILDDFSEISNDSCLLLFSTIDSNFVANKYLLTETVSSEASERPNVSIKIFTKDKLRVNWNNTGYIIVKNNDNTPLYGLPVTVTHPASTQLDFTDLDVIEENYPVTIGDKEVDLRDYATYTPYEYEADNNVTYVDQSVYIGSIMPYSEVKIPIKIRPSTTSNSRIDIFAQCELEALELIKNHGPAKYNQLRKCAQELHSQVIGQMKSELNIKSTKSTTVRNNDDTIVFWEDLASKSDGVFKSDELVLSTVKKLIDIYDFSRNIKEGIEASLQIGSRIYSYFKTANAYANSFEECNKAMDMFFPNEKTSISPDIVGSVDPSEKYCFTGKSVVIDSTTYTFMDSLQTFDYQIDFWNKESATASVIIANIVDTIHQNFDINTFKFTGAGYDNWGEEFDGGQYFNVTLDLRPEIPHLLNIEGNLDIETRVATWIFATLDTATLELTEDPLGGYMPAISENGNEISWVTYSIDPIADATEDTEFWNKAWIEFDWSNYWEDAPLGRPLESRYDTTTPISHILDLDAIQENTSFTVNITGIDSLSGIDYFDIYVSTNGGTYELWEAVYDTFFIFTGDRENQYSFFSIAHDNAGNEETMKSEGEANTYIRAAIKAGFTASVTSGEKPLSVSFTDTSWCDPSSWSWDFDNDGVVDANITNPTHQYEEAGTYSVTLAVANSLGSDTITKIDYITVTTISDITQHAVSSVIIYPNPTKSELTVASEAMFTVEIVSLTGQVLMSQEKTEEILKIDLRKQEAGVYLIRLSNDNEVIVKEIIKK